MSRRIAAAAALFALALASEVAAVTVRIPDDYSTIAEALEVCADTVVVATGTYYESDLYSLLCNGLVLRGETGDPEDVAIDAEGTARVWTLDGCSQVLVEGITFRNGDSGALWGGGVRIWNSRDCVFRHCIFEGNNSDSFGGAVVCENVAEGCVFEHCLFQYNEAHTAPALFIKDADSDGVRLTNVTIFWNDAYYNATAIYHESEPGDPAPELAIENCLIVGNGSVGTVPSITCTGDATALVSCTNIWGNSLNWFSGCIGTQGGINGNMTLDPLFCDYVGGDVRLSAQSPCAPDNNSCGVLIGSEVVGCGIRDPWYVDGTNASGNESGTSSFPFSTIQRGIDAASEGDRVFVGADTYEGHGNRDLDFGGKGILLRSTSGPENAIIDCGGSAGNEHRGFNFHNGETNSSVVRGFTVTNGYAGSSSTGGAVECSGASPTLRDMRFVGNQAGYGGAINCTNSSPSIEECVLEGNQAFRGGGLHLTNSSPIVTGGMIHNNTTSNEGGGVFISGTSNPDFTSVLFKDNSAGYLGGGVSCWGNVPTFTNCTFDGNSGVSYGGGGIFCDTDMVVENTIIANSPSGAGMFCMETSNPTITCTDIWGNAGGDWTGVIAGQLGVNGNISANPLFCGGSDPLLACYLGSESQCGPDHNPGCGLIGACGIGCEGPGTGISDWSPTELALRGNYPNPFNPETTISYELPRDCVVRLSVYTSSGRLVRTLLDGVRIGAGPRRATWNGRDDDGMSVAAGVYFCRLEVDGEVLGGKMVLLE